MAQSRYYSATAQPTVLTSGITPSSTVIIVQQTVGFPASFPYILAIDYGSPSEEVVLVTSAAGTSLTVTRAYDGTSATSHNAGAAVRHTWTALDGNDSRQHEGSNTSVHGVGTIVGTTEVQTLTNKSLTSPTITGTVAGGATYTSPTLTTPTMNGPTITGTVGGSASYTTPTITSPTITGTVGGSATYTSPTLNTATANDLTVRNSAIGVVPLTVNSIAATTANLADVQFNGTSRMSVSAVGRLTASPANTATKGVYSAAATGFTGNLFEGALNSVAKFTVTEAGNTTYTGSLTGGSAGQFAVDASGNVTAAGNITVGAWVSYTPTWGSTGTAPALGNGTITGRYSLQGKTCTVMAFLQLGTTSTIGTGTYTLTLPFASVNRANNFWVGSAMFVDSGSSNFPGIVQIDSNVSVMTLIGPTSSTQTNNGAGWGATTPVVPGTNDSYRMTVTYEIA